MGRSDHYTDFNQQRKAAWKPDLEPKTVLFSFVGIGLCFIPIGLGLLMASDSVQEKVLDYTYCYRVPQRDDLTIASLASSYITCAGYVAYSKVPVRCVCAVPLNLPEGLQGNVVIFYALSRFYQNHRHFLKSKDEFQLLGQVGLVSSNCAPFDYLNGSTIVPCGSFANAMFNDSIQLMSEGKPVPLAKTGLAWSGEKALFKNPQGQHLNESYANHVRPPAWSKNIWDLDPETAFNNGMENEDFIIWMRPSAFADFRKIYRRLDNSPKDGAASLYQNGLPPGNYTFIVEYNYPVTAYGGRKFLVVSNASAFGGKNPFLGYAYIITGSGLVLLALVLLFIHLKWGIREDEAIDVRKTDPYYY